MRGWSFPVCLFLLWGAVGTVAAREEAVPGEQEGVLERARSGLRAGTEWLASGIDGWFGDRPFSDGGKVSGRVRLKTLWRQDEGFKGGLRFRARLELPNLKERSYLFVGQDNERELVTDRPEEFSREQQLLAESRREDQTFFAGLGYAVRERVDLRLGVRGGYKLYAQARYRKRWKLSEHDRLEFIETLFWTVRDRIGSTTALNYEHAWSPTLALRWRTAGTISKRTDGLAWSSALGVFKSFGDERLLAVEAVVNGESESHVRVHEYGLRVTWREALHQDWLIGETVIGHYWPRREEDSERKRSWAAGFALEMLF